MTYETHELESQTSPSTSTEPHFRLALGFFERLRGLLGARRSRDVLMIAPCKAIHTFGLREPIDVAFVDCQGIVVASHVGCQPRRTLKCRRAVAVLERFACEEPWFIEGDSLGMLLARMTD